MNSLVKSIETNRYVIELHQTEAFQFVVSYQNKSTESETHSEPVNDFKTASYLFSLKVDELDGN